MKDKVDEYEEKLECLNIINSIQKLESDIKLLDAKFRYSNTNHNNLSNSHRNQDDEESENEANEEDEESKNDVLVPHGKVKGRTDTLSNGSKRLVSCEFNSSRDARIFVPIEVSRFENKTPNLKKQKLKRWYQEQNYIDDSNLELNFQEEQA